MGGGELGCVGRVAPHTLLQDQLRGDRRREPVMKTGEQINPAKLKPCLQGSIWSQGTKNHKNNQSRDSRGGKWGQEYNQ